MSRRIYSQTIVGITALAAVIFAAGEAQASFLNSCTIYCHGMPPRDAVRKANPHFTSQSSAFLGNHRNHLPVVPAAADCSICHAPVLPANFSHENEIIAMANSLKSYSAATIRAQYDKGTFVNQTSIPNLLNATCSNVSCHFETKTPAWGSSAYTVPANCNACHGFPPTGTLAAPSGGIAGSHARHETYFPGAAGCQKCHPGYSGFSHATSAGRPLHVQGYLRNPLDTLETGATYSGTGVNYLPSKSGSQLFGSCSNLYCHGVSMPGGDTSGTNKTPDWNSINYLPATITAAACGTCHGFPPLAASGHPGGITIPVGFPTTPIGGTCSCHSNINTSTAAASSYANIFVDGSLHVNGIFEPAASGHIFPYGGSLHMNAAGITPWAGCTGCHTNVIGGTYPVTVGTAPNCTGCHINGLSAPSGTSSCWDCHGVSATNGLPNGTVFPNNNRSHSAHVSIAGTACTICHTGGGAGTVTHGSSNRVAATQASVKVVFSTQAGPSAVWAPGTITCSTTYCHGQGAPVWGTPLWSTTDQCGKCHSSTTTGAVTAAVPFYSTAYPTKVTVDTNVRVGAHTAHITGTDSLSTPEVCIDCHGSVTLTAATHMNGTTNFSFSTLATKGGTLTPTYTLATGVCANVYCHGASMPGGDTSGTNRTPTWNVPFLPATISAAACGNCHGFPPSAANHPAGIIIPTNFGNGTVAIGATCSCHVNINNAGTTYANIFVNKALHVDGTLQVSGGHAVPYDNHNADIVAAGGNTACLGCHAMGTVATPGAYPNPTVGAAPNCMSCHRKAAPLHAGTTAGANCSSCHGNSTNTAVGTRGIPTGSAFPDLTRGHSRGNHRVVCTTCHVLGTSGGTGSGINHGRGSVTGPVRDGKPNVVGTFVNGITVTGGGVKGVSPTSVNCNHNLITGSGCSGNGTNETW